MIFHLGNPLFKLTTWFPSFIPLKEGISRTRTVGLYHLQHVVSIRAV